LPGVVQRNLDRSSYQNVSMVEEHHEEKLYETELSKAAIAKVKNSVQNLFINLEMGNWKNQYKYRTPYFPNIFVR
jgi:hypothetical protein